MNAGIEVRKVEKDDPQAMEWLRANQDNTAFDEGVLDYPASELWAARNGVTTHAYLPVQQVLVLESLGANPESSSIQVAHSMLKFVEGASLVAHRAGMRELMFLVSDDLTAQASEALGFEELKCRVMRRKIK